MLDFPESLRVPLDDWVDAAMNWILEDWAGFFEIIGDGILQFLILTERFFLWLPWPLVLALVALAAWRLMGRWWAPLVMGGLLLLIGSFGY